MTVLYVKGTPLMLYNSDSSLSLHPSCLSSSLSLSPSCLSSSLSLSPSCLSSSLPSLPLASLPPSPSLPLASLPPSPPSLLPLFLPPLPPSCLSSSLSLPPSCLSSSLPSLPLASLLPSPPSLLPLFLPPLPPSCLSSSLPSLPLASLPPSPPSLLPLFFPPLPPSCLSSSLPSLPRYLLTDTSRTMRPGEVNGKDYYFVSREQMEREIRYGHFLEHGEHKGNLYGVSIETVMKLMKEGKVPVLDLHPQVSSAGSGSVNLVTTALRVFEAVEWRGVYTDVLPLSLPSPPLPVLAHTQSLQILRSSTIMPYTVFIKAPPLDRLIVTRQATPSRKGKRDSSSFSVSNTHTL